MNFFFDKGIKVPDQISITGYDDSMYASMVRPKLTTVHQDVQKKAHMALKRLMKLIQGEELKELNIRVQDISAVLYGKMIILNL